jgi:hypothetical protein
VILPFSPSAMKELGPFLDRQGERIVPARLDGSSPYLPPEEAAAVREGKRVQGTIRVGGERYFYAARLVKKRAYVLLRPTRLGATAAEPFLEGLLIAGLVGGALAALAVASLAVFDEAAWMVILGAVVIASAANLANLLDLRPGRTIKVWYPCAIALVAFDARGTRELVLLAVTGGVSAFLPDELRERIMLGDTGAGLLGAVLGAAALDALGRPGLLVCLGVLLGLTLASELVSFTRVIESTPPLRWIDELGRNRPRGGLGGRSRERPPPDR